eukprot:1141756-Pelagomonas_calceolata.AAC.5
MVCKSMCCMFGGSIKLPLWAQSCVLLGVVMGREPVGLPPELLSAGKLCSVGAVGEAVTDMFENLGKRAGRPWAGSASPLSALELGMQTQEARGGLAALSIQTLGSAPVGAKAISCTVERTCSVRGMGLTRLRTTYGPYQLVAGSPDSQTFDCVYASRFDDHVLNVGSEECRHGSLCMPQGTGHVNPCPVTWFGKILVAWHAPSHAFV